uniref:Uncharacterized protein n=1 Tax=Syphacia muris TaxID=451379 RepID=A0A0N5AMM7_9BILA
MNPKYAENVTERRQQINDEGWQTVTGEIEKNNEQIEKMEKWRWARQGNENGRWRDGGGNFFAMVKKEKNERSEETVN